MAAAKPGLVAQLADGRQGPSASMQSGSAFGADYAKSPAAIGFRAAAGVALYDDPHRHLGWSYDHWADVLYRPAYRLPRDWLATSRSSTPSSSTQLLPAGQRRHVRRMAKAAARRLSPCRIKAHRGLTHFRLGSRNRGRAVRAVLDRVGPSPEAAYSFSCIRRWNVTTTGSTTSLSGMYRHWMLGGDRSLPPCPRMGRRRRRYRELLSSDGYEPSKRGMSSRASTTHRSGRAGRRYVPIAGCS